VQCSAHTTSVERRQILGSCQRSNVRGFSLKIWNDAANQRVLDIAIKNGDTITLSVPVRMIPEDSYTAAEIRYLEAHGYQRSGPNTLIPPFGGVH